MVSRVPYSRCPLVTPKLSLPQLLCAGLARAAWGLVEAEEEACCSPGQPAAVPSQCRLHLKKEMRQGQIRV